jgi:DNA-binding NtrC family response regulator
LRGNSQRELAHFHPDAQRIPKCGVIKAIQFIVLIGIEVSNPVLAGKRIAVIEDEVPIGAMLEIMLDELGCVHAGTARTLTEAMSLADSLDARQVDAVLLDYRLKGEGSGPAAQRFKNRGIRVIVTTGMDDHSLPDALQNCATIRKPYGIDGLEQGLIDALGPTPVKN